jgi:pentatricopeptide repeat protein
MSFSSGLIQLSGRRTFHASQYASRLLIARASSTATHGRLDFGSLLISKLNDKDGLTAIHTYYPALTTELRRTKTAPTAFSPLTRNHFHSVFDILGSSGRPLDLQRIEEILSDMPSIFGIEPSVHDHTAIIRALVKHGKTHTIYRWLYNMPSRPGRFTPTLVQFHLFLEACIHLSSYKYMRSVVLSMSRAGCKPTTETFGILIRGRLMTSPPEEKVPHVVAFSAIIDDMKREGLSYDPAIDTLLHKIYASRGFLAYAHQIRTMYRTQFPTAHAAQEQKTTEFNSKISQAAQVGGVQAAIKLFRSTQRDGEGATPAKLNAILQYSRTIDDLRTMEKELCIKATADQWSILINNNVRRGHVSEAFSVYQQMKNLGLVPDTATVTLLITTLCQSTLKPPSDNSLDHALSIYRDLKQPASSSSAPAAEDLGGSTILSADVYRTLLRGLGSSTNAAKYLPLAKSLISDMEALNISSKDSIAASSTIALLMRQSPTPSDALEVYRSLRTSLDEQGYATVLNAFCGLSFGEGIRVTSPNDYFEIVRDMRRAGLNITLEVYTIFLRHVNVVAAQLDDLEEEDAADISDELIMATRRTHDLLTLDAAVSPDAYVWNQLMIAYQSLGYFADSYRVWDIMYLSGRFDNLSVSIILEACGHTDALEVAKSICTKLFNSHFSFNLHNWNTWLECLCRLGRLNDALKFACLQMGKDESIVAPDVESARILINYSKREDQQKEVLIRIQRHQPELWKCLPEDLKQL